MTSAIIWGLVVWSLTALTVSMVTESGEDDYYQGMEYPFSVSQLESDDNNTETENLDSIKAFEVLQKTYDECRLKSTTMFCFGLKGNNESLVLCEFQTNYEEEMCSVIYKIHAYFSAGFTETDLNVTMVSEVKYPNFFLYLYDLESKKAVKTFFCNRHSNTKINMSQPFTFKPLSYFRTFYVKPTEQYCEYSFEHLSNETTWISTAITISMGLFTPNSQIASNLVNTTWPLHIVQPTSKTTASTSAVIEEKETRSRRCKTRSSHSTSNNVSYSLCLLITTIYFSILF